MSTTGQPNSPQSDQASRAHAPESTPRPADVHFWFEGRPQRGRAGDTIASALFAGGVRTLSYSVKYHRARGISCGRGRCSMCAVEVDGAPGVKACTTQLRDGMRVRRQESRPWFGPILSGVAGIIPFPAGFYYRFFTRPRWVREAFLGSLRRMAGVGKIDTSSAPAHVSAQPHGRQRVTALASRYDVVVVGAGVSGMAAAVSAASAGASVALVDEYAWLGGHAVGALNDASVCSARDDLAAAVAASARITLSLESTVQAIYADRTLLVMRGAPAAMERVRAGSVILATGAFDTIPLFVNNDLPGVFGPRGLRLFLERDRIALGSRAVIYGTGRAADDAAALLQSHGVAVAARVDEGRLIGVDGKRWVRAARVESGGGSRRIACDLVCVAVAGQPDFALTQQAGFSFELDGMSGDLAVMRPTVDHNESGGQRVFLVGETAGVTDWLRKIEHAARAGRDAAQRADNKAGRTP